MEEPVRFYPSFDILLNYNFLIKIYYEFYNLKTIHLGVGAPGWLNPSSTQLLTLGL